MGKILVYNPKPVNVKKQTDMALKISHVNSKKLALLDNLKPQSDQVLKGIAGYFEQENIQTETFKKTDTPTPVPDDVVEKIRKNYHGMVTGVGD